MKERKERRLCKQVKEGGRESANENEKKRDNEAWLEKIETGKLGRGPTLW